MWAGLYVTRSSKQQGTGQAVVNTDRAGVQPRAVHSLARQSLVGLGGSACD